MKDKHIQARIAMTLELAKLSNCERRKFGAMIINPDDATVVSDGYNGGIRGYGPKCGGDHCERTRLGIPSGERMEISCAHAEESAIVNAARQGVSTVGKWLIVTGEPCLLCARLICNAGISRVICIHGGYAGGDAGVDFLVAHGVPVSYRHGPQDPRTSHD